MFKFSWPYVQIFMALYLNSETQKEFKVRVVQRDNSSKEPEGILTDLPYGAIQRLNPLQGGARATPCLLGGTITSGESQLGDKKRPHPYSETSSLYAELPKFSSVAQSCLTLCNPMDHSTPGFHVHHQLLEPTQTQVHWVSDAIQPSHPLSNPASPAFNLSQHQGLFQWVSSSHQAAKVLEFHLQHQSFQWIFRTDLL